MSLSSQIPWNEALQAALNDENVPLTAGKFREILRQELHHAD